MLVSTYFPNQRVFTVSPASTNWTQVTSANCTYAGPGSVAVASNFPGLDAGGRVGSAVIRSADASTGVADGSAFQFLISPVSSPGASQRGKLVSGSGQTETLPGGLYASFWVKMSSATDVLEIEMWF